MFDVTLPDGKVIRESSAYRPGDRAVVADTPWGKLGLTVCYDLRFPQLYRALAQAGARYLTIPSSFQRATGKVHWHTLLKARAIENACFVFAPAMCGEHPGQPHDVRPFARRRSVGRSARRRRRSAGHRLRRRRSRARRRSAGHAAVPRARPGVRDSGCVRSTVTALRSSAQAACPGTRLAIPAQRTRQPCIANPWTDRTANCIRRGPARARAATAGASKARGRLAFLDRRRGLFRGRARGDRAREDAASSYSAGTSTAASGSCPHGANDGLPEELGDFLNEVVKRQRGPAACTCCRGTSRWSSRSTANGCRSTSSTGARTGGFTSGSTTSIPLGASHHQKVVVVDDAVAFVGGLDLTHCRWDTPEHACRRARTLRSRRQSRTARITTCR